MTPSPNGHNRRSGNGRFAMGNAGGPGNPHAAQVGVLRRALLDAVTPNDVRDIATKLVTLAKGGDLAAMKLVLDRTVGKKFVEQIESPPTLEETKAWLRERINRLIGDSGNGTATDNVAIGLSVDERRSRLIEIARRIRDERERSGTDRQTEQLKTEHDADGDTSGEVELDCGQSG